MAEGIGLSKRSYQQRKQISNINEEVRSLVDTDYANNLVETIKLSAEEDHIQMKVCDLLITGRNVEICFFPSKVCRLQTE